MDPWCKRFVGQRGKNREKEQLFSFRRKEKRDFNETYEGEERAARGRRGPKTKPAYIS